MKQSFERQMPNIITLLRIVVSVPFFILASKALVDHDANAFRWSVALLMPIALSDWLDGWLARRWKVVSTTGKWLDPLADKILIYGSLGVLTRWMCLKFSVVTVAAMLVVISFGLLMDIESQFINLSSGNGANDNGKRKFHLQLTAVTIGLVSGYFCTNKPYNLLVAGVVAMVLAAAHYYAKQSLNHKYAMRKAFVD